MASKLSNSGNPLTQVGQQGVQEAQVALGHPDHDGDGDGDHSDDSDEICKYIALNFGYDFVL